MNSMLGLLLFPYNRPMAIKYLNGSELAGYIKERHARQVRELRKTGVQLKLAIVQVKDDPVINTYVRLKKQYGDDIGIAVDIYKPKQSETIELIKKLNADQSVTAMIVQLPLPKPEDTEDIVKHIDPKKDVDALGPKSLHQPATPMAILWLLASYDVQLKGKKVVLIGRGKLVGAPLEKSLKKAGIDLFVGDKFIPWEDEAKKADVIIAAANAARILKSSMVKPGAVVVDAGTANEEGKTVGNADDDLYERDDITITPKKGGVGPLTVCALFENVIRAAQL